jgi:anaerobic magnesium-protoporphyrin IX monomethyl ester cyclase
MNMKVAFVNLPNERRVTRRFRCNVFTDAYLLPPIELISLAAIPKDIVFLDAIALGLDKEKTVEAVQKHNPDLLIFLAGFETLGSEIEFIQTFRKSGVKVGCIGYLPSLFPKEVLKKGLDFLIVGEPEEALMRIIRTEVKNIKGIYKGKPIDMDRLPVPKYELLGNEYYDIFFSKPLATIETSRGCPYGCIYCIKPFGAKIRRKSVDRVMKELVILDKLGYKSIRFSDDLFTYDKKWVVALCNKITESNLKKDFICLTRPDTFDKEMLKVMKDAGFVRFLIGIESGSERMLKYYKRNYSKKALIKNLDLLKSFGFETIGWFIVSFKDNKESIRESLDVAKKLDWIVVSVLEPRPGTELFEKSKKKFQLFPYKTEFSDKKITDKQKGWERYLITRFYMRPKNLLKISENFFSHPKRSMSLLINTLKYYIFLKSGPRPDIF